MIRRELTDVQWELIAPLVAGKVGDRGVSGRDNRLFVDAVLWIVRSGAAVAVSAGRVRQLEQHLRAVQPLG